MMKFSEPAKVRWQSMMNVYVSHIWKKTKVLDNGCIEWTGSKGWDGYGSTYMFDKQWRASRLFYFLYNGEIPEGHHVCHKCDNKSCVNPEHLFTGTANDNIQDARKKGRLRGPTGEKNGQHKLKVENVLEIRRRYVRFCRKGNNIYDLAKEFGVNPVTVHAIVSGKKWKSVQAKGSK